MWIFECETKRSIFMRFRLMLIPIIVCRIWPNMLKSRRKWSNGNRERERTNERLIDRIIFFSFLNDHRLLLEQIKISSIDDDDDDDKLNEVDLFERSLLCYEIVVSSRHWSKEWTESKKFLSAYSDSTLLGLYWQATSSGGCVYICLMRCFIVDVSKQTSDLFSSVRRYPKVSDEIKQIIVMSSKTRSAMESKFDFSDDTWTFFWSVSRSLIHPI